MRKILLLIALKYGDELLTLFQADFMIRKINSSFELDLAIHYAAGVLPSIKTKVVVLQ